MNSLPTDTPTREILWNLSSPLNPLLMYLLFAASMLIFLWGMWRRLMLWRKGKADNTRASSWTQRLGVFWRDVITQKAVSRDSAACIFHALILSGFLVLVFATTIVLLDYDFGFHIFHGSFYLAVSFLADVFGLALFFGVCLAFHRRYIQRLDHLSRSPADTYMLFLLALMIVQGFLVEAMRIYATSDPWAIFSPIGYAVSFLFWAIPISLIEPLHFFFWWFHTITVFIFIALLPYSKFLHIISSSLNCFFKDILRAKGAMRYIGDIEQLMEEAMEAEDAEDFSLGASNVGQLTWKQRLDLDACIACGRCQDACPAYASDKALSPKWLILDLRDHLLKLQSEDKLSPSSANGSMMRRVASTLNELDRKLLSKVHLAPFRSASDSSSKLHRGRNELVQNADLSLGESAETPLAGGVMPEDVFWSCTSCRACMEHCPTSVEHLDTIFDVRRAMALMEGNIPSEAQPSLRAIETRGNPFGPAESRVDWTEGFEVPILEEGAEVDVLYWVGCISAYDKRKQKVAQAMAKILNASGYRWGILGNRESCTGDPARRLGEENLFQSQAKKNIAVLSSISCSTIVANCPHCFNTLKNEYPQISDYPESRSVEVLHHTHFIKQLIAEQRISPKQNSNLKLTFHDPCYLGRYNDSYEEPREILSELGVGAIQEMELNREKAFCCGAGGGHYWFDMKVGQRVNVMRTEQALQTNADAIAAACPFCLQMLEDGIKLCDKEEELRVLDIAELVAQVL